MNTKAGDSWENATDLQTALKTLAQDGDEIWVAEGCYIPGIAKTDYFVIPEGRKIYGGFIGTETGLDYSCREGSRENTILSGDLNQDDGDGTDASKKVDNSYHVVVLKGGNTIDGFVIEKGDGNGNGAMSTLNTCGAGIHGYNFTKDIVINNNIIRNNKSHNASYTYAAGMYLLTTEVVAITVSNNLIQNNTTIPRSYGYGGGMYIEAPSSTNVATINIDNNIIANNTIQIDGSNGGGIYLKVDASKAFLVNNLITNNSLISGFGAGIYAEFYGSGLITMCNNTIVKNKLETKSNKNKGSGIFKEGSGEIRIYNSIIWGNKVTDPTQIVNQIHVNTFCIASLDYSLLEDQNSTDDGNISGNAVSASDLFTDYASNDFTLKAGSKVIDKGLDANYPGDLALDKDLANNNRKEGASIDMGAYESAALSDDATLSNLIASTGTLTPSFDMEVISYTISVPYTTTNITLTGTANDPSATVGGDGLKTLSVGSNTYEIVVTAVDGTTTKTYTVIVNRAGYNPPVPPTPQKNSNADLEYIRLSQGTLKPSFDSNIQEYTVEVTNDLLLVDAKAKAYTSTVEGTGEYKLKIGENRIEIKVTAEDGTSKTYVVLVDRIDTTVDIEVIAEKAIQVYPTLTDGKVYVKTVNGSIPMVYVYNINGKLLHKEQTIEVDLSDYPQGTYLLLVEDQVYKIIKR